MKCPNCGESLWFVKDVCPFCKTTISPERTAASTARLTQDLGDTDKPEFQTRVITYVFSNEIMASTIFAPVNTHPFIRVYVFLQDDEAVEEVLSSIGQEAEEITSEPDVNVEDPPLLPLMTCFAFTLPLLTLPGLLIFAALKGYYSNQGCERKAKELFQWFAGGVVFWVIIFTMVMMIRELME
jgi:hypothetical protein